MRSLPLSISWKTRAFVSMRNVLLPGPGNRFSLYCPTESSINGRLGGFIDIDQSFLFI
jgi:hypothetical protein